MPSALIHYVPILQRAIVGDSPLNAYVVQREQRGVRARADWLLRYLRSVTADGVFLLLKLRLFPMRAQKLGLSWSE